MNNNYIEDLVSIITPVYNAERFVEETIKSVQAQTYTNWEMILVDDLSTDNSESIIKKIQASDSRIKYIKLNENSGAAVARNTAIENARGRYIAFLDSDDLWKSNKLENQIRFMKESCCEFCFSNYEWIDEESKTLNKNIVYNGKYVDYDYLLKQNVIGCLTVVIDRKNIKDIYMPLIKHEDYATWLKILKNKRIKAFCIDDSLAKYRKSNNSLSSNKIKSAIWTWQIYRQYEALPYHRSIFYFANYIVRSLCKTFY